MAAAVTCGDDAVAASSERIGSRGDATDRWSCARDEVIAVESKSRTVSDVIGIADCQLN